MFNVSFEKSTLIITPLVVILVGSFSFNSFEVWSSEKKFFNDVQFDKTSFEVKKYKEVKQQSLSDLNFFKNSEEIKSKTEIDMIPETRLSLTLRGVISTKKKVSDSVLIEDASGNTKAYSVGDNLPGNSRLSSIMDSQVIIERGGQKERLKLSKPKKYDRNEIRQSTVSLQRNEYASGGRSQKESLSSSDERKKNIRKKLQALRDRLGQ